MRVKLLKKHTPESHSRALPVGTEIRVLNSIAKEWIKKGIAEYLDGVTKEEIETLDASIEQLEDKPVKKVTKKKESKE